MTIPDTTTILRIATHATHIGILTLAGMLAVLIFLDAFTRPSR